MNRKIAYDLHGYFEMLYDLNRNIITLCGASMAENYAYYEKTVNDIIYAIPRLVPYTYVKKKEQYEICMKDGLMEYSDDIPFLKNDYEDILNMHREFLRKIKEIRNKLEHKLHVAELKTAGSGSLILFEFVYTINEEPYSIYASEMISFVKHLNTAFTRIQELLDNYFFQEEYFHHTYFYILTRYRFQDFNKVYESDLLRIIGRTLLPFY